MLHAANISGACAGRADSYARTAGGSAHLDYYLDEFAFRFNRRRSKARGLLFHRLLQQAVAIGPATYDTIVDDTDSTKPPLGLE